MRCESLGTSFSCAATSVPHTRRARAGSTYFITSVYARTSDVASAWTFRYDRQVALRSAPRVCTPPFLGSSMAEHPAVNRRVAGSSPARGASLFKNLRTLDLSSDLHVALFRVHFMRVFLRRPRAPGCSHWPIRQRSVAMEAFERCGFSIEAPMARIRRRRSLAAFGTHCGGVTPPPNGIHTHHT